MHLLAVIVGVAMSIASSEQATIERFCSDQWGNLLPLKQSCIARQQTAATRLQQLLAGAETAGWRQEIESECALSELSDYGRAASCVGQRLEYRNWKILDRELARHAQWERPKNMPEELFVELRDACIESTLLSFSAIQYCIYHSIAHSPWRNQ